jgi:hypothetical protein
MPNYIKSVVKDRDAMQDVKVGGLHSLAGLRFRFYWSDSGPLGRQS